MCCIPLSSPAASSTPSAEVATQSTCGVGGWVVTPCDVMTSSHRSDMSKMFMLRPLRSNSTTYTHAHRLTTLCWHISSQKWNECYTCIWFLITDFPKQKIRFVIQFEMQEKVLSQFLYFPSRKAQQFRHCLCSNAHISRQFSPYICNQIFHAAFTRKTENICSHIFKFELSSPSLFVENSREKA